MTLEGVVEAEMHAMVEAAREICVEPGGIALDEWGDVTNRWGTYSDRRIWAPWWDRVLGKRSVREGIEALERALKTRRGPVYERLRAEAERRVKERAQAVVLSDVVTSWDDPEDWLEVPPGTCPYCGADDEPSEITGPGRFTCHACGREMRIVNA